MANATTLKPHVTRLAAVLGAVTLAACAAPVSPTQPSYIGTSAPVSVVPTNAPSGGAVDSFARAFLNDIQPASIRARAELCGYFFVDASGQLFGTPPITGTPARCDMPAPQPGQGIIASYHTHGAFDRGYDNEVPSVIDLKSDFQFGIDGYVSTPGGRIWLVDFDTRSTRQVCGRNCVYSDPAFEARGENRIQTSYTLPALTQRQNPFAF